MTELEVQRALDRRNWKLTNRAMVIGGIVALVVLLAEKVFH